LKTVIFSFLIIIVLSAMFVFRLLRSSRAVSTIFTGRAFNRINRNTNRISRLIKHVILSVSVVLLMWSVVLPSMSPEGEKLIRKKFMKRGAERTIFLLDVSLSMTTEDVGISRLDKAKTHIAEVMEVFAGGAFALVPFAGSAFIQCPFTEDREIIKRYLEAINSFTIRKGGSCLSAGLILTDGADFSEENQEIYNVIADSGIEVSVLGIGGDKPVPIVLAKNRGGNDLVKRDKNYNVVLTGLNKKFLKSIASLMDGKYFSSIEDLISSNRGRSKIKIIKGGKTSGENDNLFYALVVIPVLLIFAESFITTRSKKMARWKGRFEE